VLLEITDNGIGIPERIIGRIFEPYFTTKDFGSGIGLTLVYKIIKEHKGDITILSTEGEGTTFTLSFPAHKREQKLLSWEGGNNGIFNTCC
jgi:signal transduction histidine kinase